MNLFGLRRPKTEPIPHSLVVQSLEEFDSRFITAIDPSLATGFAPPRIVTFQGGDSGVVGKVKEALEATPDPDLKTIQESYGAKTSDLITLFDLAGVGNICIRDNTIIVGLRITTPGCHQIVILTNAIHHLLEQEFPGFDVLVTPDFLAFKSQLTKKDHFGQESTIPAFEMEEIKKAHERIIRSWGLEGFKVFMETVRSLVKTPDLFISQIVCEDSSSPTRLALDLVTYFEFHPGLSPHKGSKFTDAAQKIKKVGSTSPFATYITEYPKRVSEFRNKYRGDLSPKDRELAIVGIASENDKTRLKTIVRNAIAE
jgi:hypothetical protein